MGTGRIAMPSEMLEKPRAEPGGCRFSRETKTERPPEAEDAQSETGRSEAFLSCRPRKEWQEQAGLPEPHPMERANAG